MLISGFWLALGSIYCLDWRALSTNLVALSAVWQVTLSSLDRHLQIALIRPAKLSRSSKMLRLFDACSCIKLEWIVLGLRRELIPEILIDEASIQ